MSVSENIHKSTVRFECIHENGVSCGTGFWFGFKDSDVTGIPHLVTNKHVIKDVKTIKLRLNVSSRIDPNCKFFDFQIDDINDFIMHPDDDVDLCILPMGPLLARLKYEGIEVDLFFITDGNFVGGNYITPVEEVYMTGYPNGLWDSLNNRPVTRKGVTASSALEDWQGEPVFMIDMACYGGSSGSPVYIMNQGAYPTKDGGIWMGNRFIFLGILYAGPTIDAQGSINIINVPTDSSAVISTKLMMNLGLVIHAEKLNDFKPLIGL